jgi:hypothetical protein
MTKDELIDLYLLARMMHAQAAYYRRQFIEKEDFERAMKYLFEMHFWQDRIHEVVKDLKKKDWHCEAIMETWLL